MKSGEFPVLDARVRAIIQYTGQSTNNDQNNTVFLDLFDNGNAGMFFYFFNSWLALTVATLRSICTW